ATATPKAQPVVMTIQPEFWPLDLFSTTLATTPSPRMIRSIVPTNSARKGVMALVLVKDYGIELIRLAPAMSIQNHFQSCGACQFPKPVEVSGGWERGCPCPRPPRHSSSLRSVFRGPRSVPLRSVSAEPVRSAEF